MWYRENESAPFVHISNQYLLVVLPLSLSNSFFFNFNYLPFIFCSLRGNCRRPLFLHYITIKAYYILYSYVRIIHILFQYLLKNSFIFLWIIFFYLLFYIIFYLKKWCFLWWKKEYDQYHCDRHLLLLRYLWLSFLH